MKTFILTLLILGVAAFASAASSKSRAKRQGYGDLGSGDDQQTPTTQQQTYQQTQAPQQSTYQQPQQTQTPQQSTYQQPQQTQTPQQSTYQQSQQTQTPQQSTYQQSQQTTYQSQQVYQPSQSPVRPTYTQPPVAQPTYGGSGRSGAGQYGSGSGNPYQGGGGTHYGGGGSHQGGGQGTYQDYDDGANSLPGTPGRDYPIYGPNPPTTTYACGSAPYVPGYYADTTYGCQVWHICEVGGKLSTFLCPNGTIFNQKYLVCDWWYNVNCGESANYYNVNGMIGITSPGEGQNKGSGYGSTGGTYVSGNAGNPYGSRIPTTGTGVTSSSGGIYPNSGSGTGGGYVTAGGRGPAGTGYIGGGGQQTTSGGQQYYPTGQASTSGPSAPNYPTVNQQSGY